MNSQELAIFQGKNIRRHWDKEQKKWYFSIVDVIKVLTDSLNPTDYLKKLRKRDVNLGIYLGTNCPHVEMRNESNKLRKVIAGDTENIFRIIQSIPSKKAEPFKIWLSKVGTERLQDISDPERSLNRARDYWQKMGRSKKWIQQRMMGQEIRNKLTDYWSTHEVTKENEYAILTNIIHKEWSDLTVKEHKNYKGLKSENLRDHMSDAELVFTALAELSTRQIAETEEAIGFEQNKIPAKEGGRIAKRARLDLEKKTGKKVITLKNYLELKGK